MEETIKTENKKVNKKLLAGSDEKFPVDSPVIPPKNSFINGDCMEFMRTCPPNFFDLAIVDPPYGLERFKSGGSIINKYGDENGCWNNTKPTEEYFEQLFRISKNQIIWGGNNFKLPESEYFIIWQKSNAQDFSFAMVEQAWTNIKKPAKIFKHYHVQNNEPRIHPTQKPVALYRWLLKSYASVGDLILDTHVGSASSLIACVELGFDYIGFEIDKEYYTMAKSRLGRATRKYELFEAV